ncbi:MAG: WecB/TagA/CpsF family glycosyltransferase [Firmicutes bacterium]|nr:WecB/TagA/CpsF family glycosyltransferase [Bacillota bacterium]
MRLSEKKRVIIRGIGFDALTQSEAAASLSAHLQTGSGLAAVYTLNPEYLEAARRDEAGRLFRAAESAELVVADGVGIIKAARILKLPLYEKVAGVELGERMIKYAAENSIGVYLLGGKPGVAEAAAERLSGKYAGLSVLGAADGYFEKTGEASDAVIEKIAKSGAKLLFVCLGMPTQELWIYDNKKALEAAGISLAMGLGGALDVYSGGVRRAPRIFISLGLEWFWRLLREPWRWRRMLVLPRFYIAVKKEARNNKKQKV